MSKMLVLLNRLKAEARPELLTDKQSEALREIELLWSFPERVNLCGPTGSGKTMLGWVLSRSLKAYFYPSPKAFRENFQQDKGRVVVDNTPHDHQALRDVLADLQLRNARTVLLVTEQPNRLGLPTVTLPAPATEDIDIVYRNLSLMEYYALSPLREGDFWAVIHSVL